MDGILWYISLVHISNWITDQAISVDICERRLRGAVRHPGHATPGGDGITPRDVSVALTKQV